MKHFTITALLFSLMWNIQAQKTIKMDNTNKDSAAIAQLLEQYYFPGIYEGNINLLKQVYYSGTLLFGDVKGQPYFKTLEQYLDGVRNRQSPKDSGKPFKGEILSLHLVNSIAVAEVKVKMYDFIYQEYLSFHKFDGQWLLVNKMISDVAQDPTRSTANQDTNSGNKFNLLATIEILPGFEDAVRKELAAMAVETRKEPGVELFLINTSNDSPRTILIYETYKSEADFEFHKSLPHAGTFFEFVKGKIKDDKIGVTLLTAINN